jgi:hypothetical protein
LDKSFSSCHSNLQATFTVHLDLFIFLISYVVCSRDCHGLPFLFQSRIALDLPKYCISSHLLLTNFQSLNFACQSFSPKIFRFLKNLDFIILSIEAFQSHLLSLSTLKISPELLILLKCSAVFGSVNTCHTESDCISFQITFTLNVFAQTLTISNSKKESFLSNGGNLDSPALINNLVPTRNPLSSSQ